MDKTSQHEVLLEDIATHHCSLEATRIQPVPGSGSLDADIVFIGEAPGKTEDEVGIPFVGAAGKVLETGLQEIGLTREDIFITNVVKCRPPENRDPSPEDVAEHHEYLERELELVEPKLIVLLGRHALQWFIPGAKISEIRGTAKRKGNRVYFPTYHPAAVLYDPRLRETFFADIRKIPLIIKKINETPSADAAEKIEHNQLPLI